MTFMRTCLCILLYLIAVCAIAEPSQNVLKELSQRLVGVSALHGTFQQEKHLAFLQKPFTSSGQFSLDRSTGLRWQVVSPLESVMLVQGQNVLLDGKPMRDHGVGKLMAMMMLDLMEGQLTSISKYFKVTGQLSTRDWHLSLEPISSRLKSVMGHIDLRGDDYLREIVIYERGDNRTIILFTEVHPSGRTI
ncbi:MAG: outer membrane lipoprotein carrier protein LolA [Haliea sp.]|nr:outer membrane lipoprotein carrier protein LolA [Haliea sp.]